MKKYLAINLVLFLLFTHTAADEISQYKEKSFSVPIALLTPVFEGPNLSEVFITYEGLNEGWGISEGDDRYVKDTRRERVDHIYRELRTQVAYFSPFEAEIINKVCISFQKSLEIFEDDLKGNKWSRVLYHDRYLPGFFKGFYYLISAARVSYTIVPKSSCVPDTLLDLNFESQKSRKRVSGWMSDNEHKVKLRIAVKELVYELEQWRKRDLDNPDRDAWIDSSKKLMDAYNFFLQLYFNL